MSPREKGGYIDWIGSVSQALYTRVPVCGDRAGSPRLVFHVDGHTHESSGRWPSVHTRRKDEERWPAFELAWKRLVDSFLIRDEASRTDL